MTAVAKLKAPAPEPIRCPYCRHTIFTGEVIRSRLVDPINGLAKCKCKRWIKVPVMLKVT